MLCCNIASEDILARRLLKNGSSAHSSHGGMLQRMLVSRRFCGKNMLLAQKKVR
jgi:hypothetical protein